MHPLLADLSTSLCIKSDESLTALSHPLSAKGLGIDRSEKF